MYRLLALALLIAAALVPAKHFSLLLNTDLQLILGTIVVGVLVFFDPVAGMLLGLALIVLYARVHRAVLGVPLVSWPTNKRRDSLITRYVTEDDLKSAAESGVFSDEPEVKASEMESMGWRVYGAQGLDREMPGFGSV